MNDISQDLITNGTIWTTFSSSPRPWKNTCVQSDKFWKWWQSTNCSSSLRNTSLNVPRLNIWDWWFQRIKLWWTWGEFFLLSYYTYDHFWDKHSHIPYPGSLWDILFFTCSCLGGRSQEIPDHMALSMWHYTLSGTPLGNEWDHHFSGCDGSRNIPP